MARENETSGLPKRVIFAAAALQERYLNPDVAAYGRLHFADARMWSGKFRRVRKSARRDHFWFVVGRALGRGPGCPTRYEQAVSAEIRAARAAISKALGESA